MELSTFQDLMQATYGRRDSARRAGGGGRGWLAEELGELAQAVRKGTPAQQLHELGDVLAWLASLANQLGLSLEDAAARYAAGCPVAAGPLRLPRADHQPGRGRLGPLGQRVPAPTRASAIWTAFRAAPLRRLSPETNMASPLPSGSEWSSRTLPTRQSSLPAASRGVGISTTRVPGAEPAAPWHARAISGARNGRAPRGNGR